MKYAIVILMFLTVMCQAQENEENMLQVVKNFAEGAREFPTPTKLARGVFTQELLETIINSVETMLTNIILEYYQQAVRAKESMIRDMESATERLTELYADPLTVETDILRVSKLLETLLSCIPGNVMIKRRGLPELPVNEGQIIVHHGNEELPNIFLNLASLIDRDLASIWNLINDIYLAGWQKARFITLNKLQYQFRNDYLNDILRSFTCEITKININEKSMKNYVKSETWENYKRLSNKVIIARRSLEN